MLSIFIESVPLLNLSKLNSNEFGITGIGKVCCLSLQKTPGGG